jgi:starch synthase
MVTRFVSHKGHDLLIHVADEILHSGMQLAILGQGESSYERFFKELAARHRGQCSVCFGFLPDIARNIYAGSDMFLMPSKYEPCGLAQMVALRYGSIPIVRETGGLKDTITEGKNGFTFSAFNAAEMRDACFRAHSLFLSREKWNALIRKAMECDNSWITPAKNYAALYQETLRTFGSLTSGSPTSGPRTNSSKTSNPTRSPRIP